MHGNAETTRQIWRSAAGTGTGIFHKRMLHPFISTLVDSLVSIPVRKLA